MDEPKIFLQYQCPYMYYVYVYHTHGYMYIYQNIPQLIYHMVKSSTFSALYAVPIES